MIHVYIAGKFRPKGPKEFQRIELGTNVRNALAVGFSVARLGCVPVIPHSMYQEFYGFSVPESFWLEATASLLDRCDAVLLVPGWQESDGTLAERKRAKAQGIPVFETVVELREWMRDTDRFPEEAS